MKSAPNARLNRILDELDRVAVIIPSALPPRDEAQQIIMGILVREGRWEVAPNGMWRKINREYEPEEKLDTTIVSQEEQDENRGII